jgi:hypothetical protein
MRNRKVIGCKKTDKPSNTPAFGFTQPHTEDLLAELDAARARLDSSVLLLQRALDLRELLWWQCDLDDARADVNGLKYAGKAHRWWRSTQ